MMKEEINSINNAMSDACCHRFLAWKKRVTQFLQKLSLMPPFDPCFNQILCTNKRDKKHCAFIKKTIMVVVFVAVGVLCLLLLLLLLMLHHGAR